MIRVCRSLLARRRTPPCGAAGPNAAWGDHHAERPGWDCRACRTPVSSGRMLHPTGGIAQFEATFCTEMDHARADRGRVPASAIVAVAVARAWLATTDPDTRKPQGSRDTTARVVHAVAPRTGRRR